MADPQTSSQDPPVPQAVALTSMRVGDCGTLAGVHLLDEDAQLLSALGLAPSTELKLCKIGNPWILQARGTRIGLSEEVAQRLMVVPNP